MTVRSRRSSRQIPQTSSSVRLPHSRQKRTRSFTSAIAPASAPASSFGARRRWNASRCAVRVPIPGSRVSWATRFSTAGENTHSGYPHVSDTDRLEARQTHSFEAAERAAQLGLGEALRRAHRLVHGCEHHVGEELGVVGVDRLGRDLDLGDLERASRLHGHHAAARGRLDRLLRELLLGTRHLRLHVLHLLKHLVHVHGAAHSSTSWASNRSFIRATNLSSLTGSSSPASISPASPSPTLKASAKRRPVTSRSASSSTVAFFGSSASLRWKDAAAGNSTVSVSPASSAG